MSQKRRGHLLMQTNVVGLGLIAIWYTPVGKSRHELVSWTVTFSCGEVCRIRGRSQHEIIATSRREHGECRLGSACRVIACDEL